MKVIFLFFFSDMRLNYASIIVPSPHLLQLVHHTNEWLTEMTAQELMT